MRRVHILLYAFILATTCLTVSAAKKKDKPLNILAINDSIPTDTISVERFEKNAIAMVDSWYLRNYTVSGSSNMKHHGKHNPSDQDYIDRLNAMPTVIEMPYNQVVKKFIEAYTTRHNTQVQTMLGLGLYYMPIFEQELDAKGLPLELKYLPIIESALNPNAVSPAGASGLWQFMLPTGKGLGMTINSLVDERRDPYVSTQKAVAYLSDLHDMYDDWYLAIAAYNCGMGTVNKALKRCNIEGKKDYWDIYFLLPKETRDYVPAFIAANYIMTYYDMHDIKPVLAKRPLSTDTVHINTRIHFEQISTVLNLPIEAIQALNPQYKMNIIPGDSRTYSLTLPSQQIYAYIMSADSVMANQKEKFTPRGVVEPGQVTSLRADGTTMTRQLVVKYHKVRKGETLGGIALKYGVSLKKLKSWNHKRNNNLRIGERLQIQSYKTVYTNPEKDETVTKKSSKKSSKSSTSYRYHTIKRGETLSTIAEKYDGVTVSDIKRANNMYGTRITAGKKLKIPND